MHSRFVSSSLFVGIACAAVATGFGLLSLALVGAPGRLVAINAGALVVGSALVVLVNDTRMGWQRSSEAVALLTGMVLLATALFGIRLDGVARWIGFGGVLIQPAFVLLPVAVVTFARSPSILAALGIALAAAALALQPDRGMAAALAASLAVIVPFRRDRATVGALVVGAAGLIGALVRADTLPPQPFVEHVLRNAPGGTLAGAAALAGATALLVPAFAGWRAGAEERARFAVFGAFWLAALIASTVANYPTPVIGYGASAVVGYVLSLAPLSTRTNG